VREAGSEGIELVMWLIARGAMADAAGGAPPRVAHRFFTSPPATRPSAIVLEEQHHDHPRRPRRAGAFGSSTSTRSKPSTASSVSRS
jgi:hypothetical protein